MDYYGQIKKLLCLGIFTSLFSFSAYADEPASEVQPLTKAEIQKAKDSIKQNLNERIEAWGETLKPQDFERSWTGRQLNKEKRQEVCGIFQSVINDTYKLALANKQRFPEDDQKIIDDRNAFIQSFGYKNNIVDTRMGFNCRLR